MTKTFTRKQFQDYGRKGGLTNARAEPPADTPMGKLVLWGGGNIPATAKRMAKLSDVAGDHELLTKRIQASLYGWADDHIPFKRGEELERMTGGAVTATEIWRTASKFNPSATLKRGKR